jgi:ethanolamine transporter EutH
VDREVWVALGLHLGALMLAAYVLMGPARSPKLPARHRRYLVNAVVASMVALLISLCGLLDAPTHVQALIPSPS